MWTIFKITNLICIMVSSYFWMTSVIPMAPLMILMSFVMIVCLITLPIQLKFDVRTGVSLLLYVLLVLWSLFSRGIGYGMVFASLYLPVFFLLQLPHEYKVDLLKFVTKWMAILLIPSLILYWITLIIDIPDFGTFVHPDYPPYTNYIFFIKTTYDFGFFPRFNAFFLEPGVVAMVCLFLIIANNFDLKHNPWLWVLLTAIIFSFSLAGYLLTLTSIALFKVNTIKKGLAFLTVVIIMVIAIQNIAGGDNVFNELILERLEYDESKGIKGNNRFSNNTDYAFDKSLTTGDYWIGISSKENMDLITGSGIKIYILRYGAIGMLIVLALYLSFIPPHPNWPYTLKFLFILIVCFMQNAYPEFYSWLFPFIIGVNINRKVYNSDEENRQQVNLQL